jgi:hypothetical protein
MPNGTHAAKRVSVPHQSRSSSCGRRFEAGQTIANAAVVKIGQSGAVCVFVSEATQLIVDVGG